MNEKEFADRFNRDIDHLVDKNMKSHSELAPFEYVQSIDLARRLTETDFSTMSRIKKPLLDQLMNKTPSEVTMSNIQKRAPRLHLALMGLVSLLIVLMISTGTLQAAAKSLTEFIQSIRVGDFTWIQVDGSESETHEKETGSVLPAIEYKNGIWILRTAIGHFGGDPLPGHDVKVQKFSSIDQAQSFVPFAIRQPTFLPAGYEFREVMVSPSDWVFLFYDGINGDLVIAQLPVGKVTVNEPSQQIDSMPVGPVTVGQLNTVGVGMLTEKQVRPVTINGQPAAWVEETGLMWETDGISFMIGGPGITQEEITQTAESLK